MPLLSIPASLRRLRDPEDGSMLILGLWLALLVLGVTGFAVDMMRVEADRVRVQNAVDTAVLAAADLKQKGEPAQVVKDYMEAAGVLNYLDGEPTVDDTNGRVVTARTKHSTNTLFWMFQDKVSVNGGSAAANNLPKIEVSLVLDISGSMRETGKDEDGNSLDQSRIEAMRDAASEFVDTLLASNSNDVSVSVVPFSSQVSIGPEVFAKLPIDNTIPARNHTDSYCIDLPDSAFDSTQIDTSITYKHTQHIQFFPGSGSSDVSMPLCPTRASEISSVVQSDAATLKTRIGDMIPTNNTAIQYGVFWGAALLDGRNRALFADAVGTGMTSRPLDAGAGVHKLLILLSDGQNSTTYRVKDYVYDQDYQIARTRRERRCERKYHYYYGYYYSCYYVDIDDSYVVNREFWRTHNFYDWYRNDSYDRNGNTYLRSGDGFQSYYGWGPMITAVTDNSSSNDQMSRICKAARDAGITIYGIGVQMPEIGVAPMMDCVSSSGHYFDVSEAQIDQAFDSILNDTIALRLVK